MGDLVELAARCERAVGADRILDRDIELAFPYEDAKHLAFGLPQYTGSIDWAMTLVPEGSWDHMEVYKPDHQTLGWTVHLLPNANSPQQHATGFAQTWPLALCAAALRARATVAKYSSQTPPDAEG